MKAYEKVFWGLAIVLGAFLLFKAGEALLGRYGLEKINACVVQAQASDPLFGVAQEHLFNLGPLGDQWVICELRPGGLYFVQSAAWSGITERWYYSEKKLILPSWTDG